jgi:phytoene dehydrogenase-like protein
MIERPDEQVLRGEVGRAGEINRNIKNVGSSIASAALGAGSAAIGSKIMPFLSSYIPASLAMKGIKKVAPQLGEALSKGMDQGLNLEEGFEYLRDAFSSKSKDKKSNLQKYAPEVYEKMKEMVQQGENPRRALMRMLADKKHQEKLMRMQKDLGMDMYDIAEQAFRKESPQGQSAQDQNMQQGSPQQTPSQQPMQQQAQQPMQNNQQQGQGAQKLLSILQQLKQARGG